MSKTLWHTIQIEIPKEMAELTKQGKVVIKKTLTKTSNISKSQKQPAIKLIPANILKPTIINDGKVWNIDELKTRMTKARALQNKNKDKNIFEPTEKKMLYLNKFEDNIIKRAKELGTMKQNENKNKILKFGDIQAPNQVERPYKGLYNTGMYNQELQDVYTYIIDYYWNNAYKFIEQQEVPTKDELTRISELLYKITKKYYKIHTYYSNGNVFSASNGLWGYLKNITNDQYKIIMKIAYNDGKNKNHKLLYSACNIHKKKLEDIEKEKINQMNQREKELNNRSPAEIQKEKDFRQKLSNNELVM